MRANGYSASVKIRSSSVKRAAAVVVMVALGMGAVRAQAASDTREIKAREDFAAGRFQEALDIFARLYAETLHPIYLRNIGRCYQNLGNPDRAIATFRDYLRKAKGLSSDEQKEIEGYIKEMEDLKRQRESAAAAPPPAPAATSAPVTPLPSASPSPSPSAAPEPTKQTQAVLVGTPTTTAPAESPIYTKWWFWTLVGAVVVGGAVGVLAATGTFNKTENAPCPTSDGFVCPR
jgi:tetratricopeptide (TPR) repeat protein